MKEKRYKNNGTRTSVQEKRYRKIGTGNTVQEKRYKNNGKGEGSSVGGGVRAVLESSLACIHALISDTRRLHNQTPVPQQHVPEGDAEGDVGVKYARRTEEIQYQDAFPYSLWLIFGDFIQLEKLILGLE
ncbi:hypothetical protein E2C01_073445 [Portunus trituberculatus]|uniref:Uncharacterized protein n=1 Tax=Portunus trituberculatus TaxID=210409 RepID=A0A5B7IDK1_PORTR|nr:hypothetical protein [Portunus trituberculatus]